MELTDLEERLTIELEKEESWKEEHKEIAGLCMLAKKPYHVTMQSVSFAPPPDFATDADNKHSQYLQDRSKLLEQCKVSKQLKPHC